MINNNLKFLIAITLIACTATVSSDIYAPSIPEISNYFDISISLAQSSMVIFMFSLACSQLIYGPLADVYGRKKPLILGTIIFIIGNILSVFSNDILMLNFSRFIQGFGAGASASLWRTMFRDKYSSTDMAKYGGYLTIAMTFIMPAAPLVGGYLQEIFSWQASFIFMIIYAITGVFFIVLFIAESHKINDIHKFSFINILKNYSTLISNKVFIGYTFCSFLCFGALFSWFIIGPVIIIHHLEHTPSLFGWLALICAGFPIFIGGYLNGKFVNTYGSQNLLKFGWSVMFIAGILLFFGFYIFGVNVLAIFIPITLFNLGICFVFPNSFAQAFEPFGHIAGTASALYGCLQIAGAVIIGAIASYVPNNNQVPLAIIMMISPVLSWLIYKILKLNEL
ncbi:multidrug effflux MFS transporter [Candidatus Bandiella numerosa]|uniref:multidrug effflux MFS transporter n=1 Tax=Candidatus Bandiella numerosa TaxID=2570586 RepID=UPI00249E378B|nr:multidrug effflux MFS transporter [Candidatus Bandiella numerosa]WHA05508.1 multidrug effflux MFS transporter [Candidatus Bandiella numerosa]